MGDYNDGFGMKFPKLTAERYHSWKFNMMMYLKGNDLWNFLVMHRAPDIERIQVGVPGMKSMQHL